MQYDVIITFLYTWVTLYLYRYYMIVLFLFLTGLYLLRNLYVYKKRTIQESKYYACYNLLPLDPL